MALAKELSKDYLVVSLDFQTIGSASFENENAFAFAFLRLFLRELQRHREMERKDVCEFVKEMQKVANAGTRQFDFMELFGSLLDFCENSKRPLVLIIDEVDSASNNQVFIDFLAQLRNYYLEREAKGTPAFQSVILAGVYDIKNLKRKLRSEGESKTNSPWNMRVGNESNECLHSFDDCPRDYKAFTPYNIAAEFNINMSLSKEGISGMLREYETDYGTGMDMDEMAGLLYDYTSGYPYLVSRLCKLMDERIGGMDDARRKEAWTKEGLLEAVRILLLERNTLFESLIGKVEDYPKLEQMLRELLFSGRDISYNPANQIIGLAQMFGFVKNESGKVILANRIFDTFLYNFFVHGRDEDI